MFVQVIQGKVRDRDGLQRQLDKWSTEQAPNAEGFLGSTGGITDDGMFVMLARFESEEAARRNSDRPEQGAWWAETERCFDGEVQFMDCPQVSTWMQGGSDDAGFVQVMEGHSPKREHMIELLERYSDRIHEMRPEIIGATIARHGEDGFIEAVYFTSEKEAREHENMEMPEDMRDAMREMNEGDIKYLDLHKPMMVSARR